jgi:hypothetical protein
MFCTINFASINHILRVDHNYLQIQMFPQAPLWREVSSPANGLGLEYICTSICIADLEDPALLLITTQAYFCLVYGWGCTGKWPSFYTISARNG